MFIAVRSAMALLAGKKSPASYVGSQFLLVQTKKHVVKNARILIGQELNINKEIQGKIK